jgi:hypothetical protein
MAPIGCALLNNEPSALAINVADETIWLAGYGRLKLFRTLFRMFRTFCVSDASFGRLWYGNLKKNKPKTQSPKVYLARVTATRVPPPFLILLLGAQIHRAVGLCRR